MNLHVSALIACLISTVSTSSAQAAEITSLTLKGGDAVITIIGEIKSTDPAKFRNEAGKYDDVLVLLESNGGSTAAAIKIGEAIRLKGFSTAVVNGSECNSACALIWLAGSPRALSKSGKVGFHATYIETVGGQAESGVGNAMVGRYLTLLNLPERAIIFATMAPPTQFNWLDSKNYGSTGIDVTIIDDFDDDARNPKESKSNTKQIVETKVWKKSGLWTVGVDYTLGNRCYLYASWVSNTVFRIGITSDKQYYVMIGNQSWTSLVENQKYKIRYQFDSQAGWNAPAVGKKLANSIFLYTTFSDPRFWAEFVQSKMLNISREGRHVADLQMQGTKLAFDELVSCQRAQLQSQRPSDPFAD